MGETLSALISFVGILILFSVIVQSMQEAMKNILKLRLGVWERFFINLYCKDTELALGRISLGKRLKMFFNRIWQGNFNGEFDKGFARLQQVLITADDNLKLLKKSLHYIIELDPGAADTPRRIGYQLQPLLDAIGRIKGLGLPKYLNIYEEVFGKQELNLLYSEIRAFELHHAEIGHRMHVLTTRGVVEFQTICKRLMRVLAAVDDLDMHSLENRISEYRIQAEQNIDSWISRINEEYGRNMQKWTVIIGFIFVIVANADSFSIYQYLFASPTAQAEIAERVSNISTVQQSDPDHINRIGELLKASDLAAARKLMDRVLLNLENDYRTLAAGAEADEIHRVREKLPGIDTEDSAEARKDLQEEYDKIIGFYLKLPKVMMDSQMQGLTDLGLPLGWPADIERYLSFQKVIDDVDASQEAIQQASGERRKFVFKKIGGLLLTAILITFGAPFWNDILGALTGIKQISRRGGRTPAA